MQLLS